MDKGNLAQWVSAIVTFLAILIALFKEGLIRWWRRPKFEWRVRLASPDCRKTEMTQTNSRTGEIVDRFDVYYLRVWIENKGKSSAERVQVFLANVLRRQADGKSFKQIDNFSPMNLEWSHIRTTDGQPAIFAEVMHPHMGTYCNIGHIIDPVKSGGQVICKLNVEIPLNTGCHLLGEGVYHLELKIAGANVKPTTRILELTITGKWYPEENNMFSNGVGFNII